MALADTWRITKSKNACCGCGSEFSSGQTVFSGLTEDGADLARLDFCTGCWSEPRAGDYFCFWRSRRVSSARQQVVNTDLMLEFFDRLDSLDTDKRAVFRFVLALYLMRKKEFKLLEVARADGVEKLVFERRKSGDRVDVESPGLTEEQIQDTEAQLCRLLSTCL
jgi:hypothetical protein